MNLVHWLLYGPLANAVQIGGGAIAVVIWRRARCRVPWCHRIGRHEVGGTVWKTCDRHLSHAHHAVLFRRHRRVNPRLHRHLNPGPEPLP